MVRLFARVLPLVLLLAAAPARADQVTIFAAASMKNAMDEIAKTYGEETGNSMAVSLAGSSALARQIQQGAPADIFISANPDWMDRLEQDGLVATDSRFDLLSNPSPALP